jgi:flavin prenyltransferase
MAQQRLIVGITGASGIIYGIRLLEMLTELKVERHLVVSKGAELTRNYESSLSAKELQSLASVSYSYQNIGAAIASGSFKTDGMIIAPCSMKTLAEIATGITTNLISRAADVVLKERRRLVLMVREAPLHSIHLEHMLKLSQLGAIIVPPVPAFYTHPKSIDDIVNHTVGRALDLFDYDVTQIKRWGVAGCELS